MAQALTFRYYGPINRFDHHRIPSEGGRAEDPERGIYYAGFTLSSVSRITDQLQ
jgi:hypothetical protein